MEIKELKQAFEAAYGQAPAAVYFSPGRVNLIGEHTDYNGGCVFPCALSFGTYMLVGPAGDQALHFKSLNMPEIVSVPLSELTTPLPNRSWVNYPLGCIAEYVGMGHQIPALNILVWGNVPAGAGLSSSAALEVVTAFMINDQLGLNYNRTDFAKIGQQSEHKFAGVNCGIMDQFASSWGKKDHAIHLNCDTLEFEHVPVKLQGVKVVISNTHSPHHLDSGAYNDRVAQCHLAVEQLQSVKPGLKYLAELTEEEFKKVESAITDPIAHKRARHVVGEVQRTADAVDALKMGDIEKFGKLMCQSHVSLRDDYEVTGDQLDAMAEEAWKIEGVLGSRMTGGGFGGCTVSLVKDEAIETFKQEVGKHYKERTGLDAEFYVAEISDGARRVE